MIAGNVGFKVKDKRLVLNDLLNRIRELNVYVGIPEDEDKREEGKIGNAALLYVHTNGSPLHKIPPRPVIEPAIEAEDNKKHIAKQMALSAKAILNDDVEKGKEHLKLAGDEGAIAAYNWFEDPRNNWEENLPATVRRKMKKKFKDNKKEFDKAMLVYNMGLGGNQVLVDTAAMRNAIKRVNGWD